MTGLPCSTHFRWFGRAVGSVIPIRRAGDVRQPPLMAVPAVETIHLEGPESGQEVLDYDEPVAVADVHAERAVGHTPCFRCGARPRPRAPVPVLIGAIVG